MHVCMPEDMGISAEMHALLTSHLLASKSPHAQKCSAPPHAKLLSMLRCAWLGYLGLQLQCLGPALQHAAGCQ